MDLLQKLLLIIILSLICRSIVFSQSDQIYFEHITPEQGLSQNDVNCIFQDRRGFMWFGTNDGLNRYDGYSFEIFKPEAGNPHSINSNLILAMDEDMQGRIWIGTASAGINCFDPVSNKFYHFLETSDNAYYPIHEHILDLQVDAYGQLWVVTLEGVEVFEIAEKFSPEGNSIPALFKKDRPSIIPQGQFSVISQDRDNNIWIGGDEGLFLLSNLDQGNLAYKVEKITLSAQSPNLFINAISTHLSHALVIGTNLGVFYVPDIKKIASSPEETVMLVSGSFGEIQVDKHNQIWAGSTNGLAQLNKVGHNPLPQVIKIHRNDLNIPNSLNKNVILSLFRDRYGLIWVGTNGGGVNKFDPEKKPFSHFRKTLNPGSISYNKIRSIFEDSKGNLWIGTEGGGLNFQPAQYMDENYDHFQSLANPKNVFAIAEVKEGKQANLFLGTQSNLGLYKIKMPARGETIISEDLTVIPEIVHSVFALLNDDNKFLWAGTYNGGLYRMPITGEGDYDTNARFLHDVEKPKSLSNNIIRSLLKDEAGNIWIGTGKGLNKIAADHKNTENPTFIRYHNSSQDSQSISHNYILALHESREGDLWVGTFGGGLNKLIPGEKGEADRFIRYSEKNGLPNGVVKGILEDEWGHLWLATNKGLSRFDPRVGTFKNYDTHDGLQSTEFSELACLTRKNGEMLFGGVNGFNAFFPGNITNNTDAPKVVFTNLEVVNKPVSVGEEANGRILLGKAISEIDHINLKYNENSFSLAFAALHFSASEKNRYKYKLEGFDKDWISVNSLKRFATYTNLEPGDYTILVKASNNDGIWNETPSQISIHIAPPFWKTWVAYLIYAVILIGLLIAVQLYTFIGIKEKHALVLEHLEKEKTDELNLLKLQFFTNISHELRTPLTLISGPMDYLLKSGKGLGYDEREYQYNLIKKNTNYLLRLVNQLLEFRKMDRGKIQLQVQQGDIVSFLREISEPFQFIAKKKQINYELLPSNVRKELWYDSGIIEKVLYNLLSNAFKFTPKQESITVELSIKPQVDKSSKKEGGSGVLEICVRDTGPGIPKKNHDKIFERYYNDPQLKDLQVMGTGIGLAYTKSLVELHKGRIQVQSEEGKGAAFIVCIPINKNSYTKTEIADASFSSPKLTSDPLTYLSDISEEDPREAGAKASDHYQLGLPYLLVIDDSKDIRKHIKISLLNEYNIVEAENGSEGLSLANEIMPDLIICDVMMPIMDGIEFCKSLKTGAKTSHIPVVLLTAKSSEESEIEGLKIGADAYIRKPFHMEKLRIKLQNILKQRSELKDRFRKEILLQPEEVTVTSTDEIFLSKAMDLVEEHMADPEFNVENMVQEIGMSRSKLYLKLKALTGQSSSEFIRTVRLKRAVQLLESSDLTVKEIMYMTGFNTASYFSKCFKKQFGISPSEYVTKPSIKKV